MTDASQYDCDKVLLTLSDYLDGEMRVEVCRALEAHLENCEDCRIVVDTTRKAIYLVHTASEECAPCPAEVRTRLLHRLDLDKLPGTSQS